MEQLLFLPQDHSPFPLRLLVHTCLLSSVSKLNYTLGFWELFIVWGSVEEGEQHSGPVSHRIKLEQLQKQRQREVTVVYSVPGQRC